MTADNTRKSTIKQPTMQSITLSEFRSWLAGVEAMAGKNWAPTKSQWKTIRKQIDSIKEQPAQVQNNQNPQFIQRAPPPVSPSQLQSSLITEETVVANNDNTAELIRKAKTRMRTGGIPGEEKVEPNIAGTVNGPPQISSFV